MTVSVGASEGFVLEPARPGVHDAVLAEVVDLGEQDSRFGRQHRGILMFQLAETFETDFDGKKETRRKEARAYFDIPRGLGSVKHKKGTFLRRIIEGWRGRKFTQDELLAFKPTSQGGGGKQLVLDQLVGRPCQVLVELAESEEGREFAKLIAVMPPNEDEAKRISLNDGFAYRPYYERKEDENGGGGEQDQGEGGSQDDDAMPWEL